MTEKRVKAWARTVFYILAAIGLVDMAAQAISDGKVRPIRSTLTLIFGERVVPVTIIVEEK